MKRAGAVILILMSLILVLGGCGAKDRKAKKVIAAQAESVGLVKLPANKLDFDISDQRADKSVMPGMAARLEMDLKKSLAAPDPDYQGGKYKVIITIAGVDTVVSEQTAKLFSGYVNYLQRNVTITVTGSINRPDNSVIDQGSLSGTSQSFKQEQDPEDYGVEQAYRNLLHKAILVLRRNTRNMR
jgi:hypothetical protein